MTEFEKVFIDTAPYIYLLEKNDLFMEKTENFFKYCISNQKHLYTSAITIKEFSVGPYKEADRKLIEDFRAFLKDTHTSILRIDEDIADEAAMIRSRYTGFKAMDALQLASAKISECDLFLTNDRQLRQYDDIKVFTIDDVIS